MDRMKYTTKLDRGLKETITLLEESGVLKRGAVCNHINEELWVWLRPMREVLDQNQLRFEGSGEEESEVESVQQTDIQPVSAPADSSAA